MARPCSICTHAACGTIDQALAAGLSYRTLAHSYGVSKSALLRHQQHQETLSVTDTVTVTGHGAAPAPLPCSCPCTHVDWHALAREAQQLCEGMRDRRDPYVAVEVLKVTLALLAKLTASACPP